MKRSEVTGNWTSVRPPGDLGELMTVAQVALFLNAHPHSVRRWAAKGLIPCYRFGLRGDRRFNAEDVEVFPASFSRSMGISRHPQVGLAGHPVLTGSPRGPAASGVLRTPAHWE